MRTALVLALCLYSCDPPTPPARECETDAQCSARLQCTPGFALYCQQPQKRCGCRPDHRRDMAGGADMAAIVPAVPDHCQ